MADDQSIPIQQGHQQSSPRLSDSDLLEVVQARNTTTTNIQLGKQLEKPPLIEQSPSTGFVFSQFGKASKAVPGTSSTVAGSNVAVGKDDGDTIATIGSSIGKHKPAPQPIATTSGKILDLSTVITQPSASHASTAATIEAANSGTIPSKGQPSQIVSKMAAPPKAHQNVQIARDVQAIISSVDAPTVLKILAYNYQKDASRHKKLIHDLRYEIKQRSVELEEAIRKAQEYRSTIQLMETHTEQLQLQVDSLQKQLNDASRGSTSEYDIMNTLNILAMKIDALCKERRKENQDADELSKANTQLRQMADELRQYRARESPQKLFVDVSSRILQTIPFTKEAVESQELFHTSQQRHVLEELRQSTLKDPSIKRITDVAASEGKDESQELPHTGRIHDEFDIDEEGFSQLAKDCQEIPDTPSANTSIRRIPPAEDLESISMGDAIPMINKFGKRNRGDDGSVYSRRSENHASKKPTLSQPKPDVGASSKRTPSVLAKHNVGFISARTILGPLSGNTTGTPRKSSSKSVIQSKSNRGQGAKWTTIFTTSREDAADD